MSKIITITFKESGEGELRASGLGTFPCLGKPGFPYKPEVMIGPNDKFRNKWSSQYEVNMPWAILVHWERGAFIHEMPATLASNGGPTAGCIHLDKGNAEKVWHWATGRVRVQIQTPW